MWCLLQVIPGTVSVATTAANGGVASGVASGGLNPNASVFHSAKLTSNTASAAADSGNTTVMTSQQPLSPDVNCSETPYVTSAAYTPDSSSAGGDTPYATSMVDDADGLSDSQCHYQTTDTQVALINGAVVTSSAVDATAAIDSTTAGSMDNGQCSWCFALLGCACVLPILRPSQPHHTRTHS